MKSIKNKVQGTDDIKWHNLGCNVPVIIIIKGTKYEMIVPGKALNISMRL